MSKDNKHGWVCPNCNTAYNPSVEKCECAKAKQTVITWPYTPPTDTTGVKPYTMPIDWWRQNQTTITYPAVTITADTDWFSSSNFNIADTLCTNTRP